MRSAAGLIPEIFSEALAQFQNKAFLIKMLSSGKDDETISSDEEVVTEKKKSTQQNFDVMIHRQLMLKKQRLQEMRSKGGNPRTEPKQNHQRK